MLALGVPLAQIGSDNTGDGLYVPINVVYVMLLLPSTE